MQNDLIINLTRVLTHTVRYEVEQEFPARHCSSFRCEDDDAPEATESMGDVLTALRENLPGLMQVMGDNLGGFEQKIFDSKAAISPQEAALQTRIFGEQGPALNEIGNRIAEMNAMAQATREGKVLEGPGGDLIRKALGLEKEIDPEFFKLREGLGESGTRLLAETTSNLGDGLSGAERSEVERSINRDNASSGEVSSNIGNVANALAYGRAGEQRRTNRIGAAAGAIQSVGGILPNTRSGIDPLQTGVGRASGPNSGDARFRGVNDQVGQTSANQVGNIFGSASQFQQQANEINANKRDVFDRIAQGAGSVSC